MGGTLITPKLQRCRTPVKKFVSMHTPVLLLNGFNLEFRNVFMQIEY